MNKIVTIAVCIIAAANVYGPVRQTVKEHQQAEQKAKRARFEEKWRVKDYWVQVSCRLAESNNREDMEISYAIMLEQFPELGKAASAPYSPAEQVVLAEKLKAWRARH